MVAVAAMRMSVSATSVRCSKSRTRRRFLMSHAKLRSITHRRGCGSNRGRARGRVTMDSVSLAFCFRPGDELAGVSAIGEHGFDEGPEAASGAQQGLGAVAVLNAAGMDLNFEQAAVGVGQDVPLASRDLLARVVAARAPF